MYANDDYFFKNEITLNLDAKYGDLSSKITDKIYTIFRELENEIFKHK